MMKEKTIKGKDLDFFWLFLILIFLPEDPVFGNPDKVHLDFFILIFIRDTMNMSVIFFGIFVPIKLTFMTGINRKKIVFSTFIIPFF